MRYLLAVLPVAALLALGAGCGGGSSGVGKGVVAVVGGNTITRAEFDQLLGQAERSYKAQRRQFPKAGSSEYRALQDQAVQFLVQRAEFAQKAKELGVSVADQQVEDRLNQVKKQYFGGSKKRYEAQLKQQGLTDAQVRQDIRAQLVSEGIFKKVTSGAKVTEAEVNDYYLKHPEQYSQPQSRQVRHILVKSKALADKLYKQLTAGADFAALAKKNSQDPGSKSLGGKLTVSKGQTVPEFDKVAFSLKTKEISKPVKTQYGWHIIQALGPVKPRQTTPLDKVKTAIRQQLLQQKRSDATTKWVEGVKKDFCKGKLKFGVGFTPSPDPCAPSTSTTAPTG